MKYNTDNRNRGVDPRLLGNLLGSSTPIDCNTAGGGCGCSNSHPSQRAWRQIDGHVHTCSQNNCACDDTHTDNAYLASACMGNASLAMVYSPYQHFHMLYSPSEGLSRGTLFRELDKPWTAGGMR